MKYNKKVSICMMIKNEEKNLQRCLKSIRPIIDEGLGELIIIDTGSEDNSIKIAREYTEKVYTHQWSNNFSEMRNISLSYAKGEWIWIMDADEEIENPEEMVKLFKSDLSKYNTIIIKMKNYFTRPEEDVIAEYNISNLNRGFRNNEDFRFEGAIHEQPKFKAPLLTSGIVFKHYGYIWDNKEFTNMKFKRNTGILKSELEKNPDNIYYNFQLAVSWAIIDMNEGLQHIKKTYELIEKLSFKDKKKYTYVYGIYARIAYANKKYMEVINICKEGLTLTKDYIDLWYFWGSASLEINDDEDTIYAFSSYLQCKESFKKTTLSQNPSYTFYCLDDNSLQFALCSISIAYMRRNDYNNAMRYISNAKPSDLKSKVIVNISMQPNMQQIVTEYISDIGSNQELLDNFIDMLEAQTFKKEIKFNLIDNIIEFYTLNKKEHEPYYILNAVRRYTEINKVIPDKLLNQIIDLDYDNLKDFYGEIILYIIKQNLDISKFNNLQSSNNISKFMRYLFQYKDDIDNEIVQYLYSYNNREDILSIHSWISIAGIVLLRAKIEEEDYKKTFESYISKGIKYINFIYKPDALDDELINMVSNQEHRFFYFMEQAFKIKEYDLKVYIQYLRKALKTQPLKKGIEILIDDIKMDNLYLQEEEKKNPANEFEAYKKIVIQNINFLIESKKVQEAKVLINEYLSIIPDDLEMLKLNESI